MTDFQTDSIFAFDSQLDEDLELQEDRALTGYTTPDSPTPVSERPRPVRTLTNSPRCTPTDQEQPFRATPSPSSSLTSSDSPVSPARSRTPGAPRRVRPVQVSAWAVPASSVNWSNPQPRSRARTQPQSSARKAAFRGTRSSDWALPFWPF